MKWFCRRHFHCQSILDIFWFHLLWKHKVTKFENFWIIIAWSQKTFELVTLIRKSHYVILRRRLCSIRLCKMMSPFIFYFDCILLTVQCENLIWQWFYKSLKLLCNSKSHFPLITAIRRDSTVRSRCGAQVSKVFQHCKYKYT